MERLWLPGPVLLAFILAISAVSAAAAEQPVSSQELQDQVFFAGLVTGIDRDAGRITVEEAGSDRVMTFTIPDGTSIVRDESAIRFDAIQVGDPVAIEYRPSGGAAVAASIKVITPPGGDS